MTYVYVIQDHSHEIRGVKSTLAAAKDVFECVMTEIMTSDEFQEYQRLMAEDPDMWGPWILVYEVDGGCIWSYESLDEISAALKDGEQYDD